MIYKKMRFFENFKLCTSVAFVVLPLIYTVVSCDENNLSNGESVLRPSTADYDYLYDEMAKLYVIQDDTIEYNLNNYNSELSTEESKINNRLNDYSSEMLKDYAEINKNENTILSPISAIMVYTMMANFPADDSKNIFKEVMHIDDCNMYDINSYSRKVINHEIKLSRIQERDNDCQIFNNIWMNKDATIYQSYLSMANFYSTKVKGVDMGDSNSLKEINDEIKKQVDSSADGSIADIGISKESLSSVNSIVTSSLSFKQEWANIFETDSENTAFKNADGTIVHKRMLRMLTKRSAFCVGFVLAEIPYKNEDFSMYVFLPETDMSVNDCISKVNEQGLQECLLKLKYPLTNTYVYMSIPQINYQTTTALNPSGGMINQDVKKMYATNLPKVSPSGFSLNNIYQSCSIDINKYGTNAISNAYVIGKTEPVPLTSPPGGPITNDKTGPIYQRNYIANRPFIILIRNNKFGNILFACCVNKINN